MRRLSTVTATLLTVVAGLAVSAAGAPAQAAEGDEGPIRVAITGLSPVAPGPNSTIIITGNLSNTGLDDLSLVSVRLSLSSAPLPDRRAIKQAVESTGDLTDYALYTTETLVAKNLRAGRTDKFEIRAKAADLLLPAPGVYALSVEAVGTGPAGYDTLGVAHTALPWLPDPTTPVRLSWLWPFATWPGQTANGVFLGDLLPRELDSGGRLENILDAAATAPDLVTWVVDPQLLQAASDLQGGYLVEDDGQVRPGTEQGAARRWLEDFRAATSEVERPRGRAPRQPPVLWDLPYADIDADAVERAKLDGDVIRAVTSAPTVTRKNLGRPAEGTFYWAPGGRVSQGTLDVLASSGVEAVILRDNALRPFPAVTYTPSGYADLDTRFGTVRALLIDSGLLDAFTMPQGNRSEIIALRQRVLCELAFVSLESGDESRHLVAAAGSTRWDPDPLMLRVLLTSLRAAPWARLVPADDILALPSPALSRVTADYDTKSRSRELEEDYMSRVKRAQEDLASIRSVVVDPIGISEPISAALLRAESSAWRTRPRAGEQLLTTIQRTIDARMTQLYIVPRDNVTFSGDRGRVPVTVANEFDSSVIVGVTLTGNPAARLSTEALDQVEIEPGRRASLEVPVRIVGSEPLRVTIQLVDERGRSFGEPAVMVLQTTAYSRAALWVVVGAALILAVLVVFDIVRRARGRGRAVRQATPAEPETT
ncbi:MAG: DUF6049 family protein [bacterium]